MLLTCNLVSSEHQHRLMDREIVSFVSFLNMKLSSSKFIELDVCGRPLFANPVTNIQLYSSLIEVQSYFGKSIHNCKYLNT